MSTSHRDASASDATPSSGTGTPPPVGVVVPRLVFISASFLVKEYTAIPPLVLQHAIFFFGSDRRWVFPATKQEEMTSRRQPTKYLDFPEEFKQLILEKERQGRVVWLKPDCNYGLVSKKLSAIPTLRLVVAQPQRSAADGGTNTDLPSASSSSSFRYPSGYKEAAAEEDMDIRSGTTLKLVEDDDAATTAGNHRMMMMPSLRLDKQWWKDCYDKKKDHIPVTEDEEDEEVAVVEAETDGEQQEEVANRNVADVAKHQDEKKGTAILLKKRHPPQRPVFIRSPQPFAPSADRVVANFAVGDHDYSTTMELLWQSNSWGEGQQEWVPLLSYQNLDLS